MRESYFHQKVNGEVMIFDSLVGMAEETAAKQKGLTRFAPCRIAPKQSMEGWTGSQPMSWDEVPQCTTRSWSVAKDQVQGIINQLVEGDTLPRPKSRKRTRRFSEDDGTDVSYDRLAAGHDWWEDTYRANRRGPTTVTIFTNLDAGASTGPYSIFWRGAAAIAATDILENAGYMVELIMWCKGRSVFPHPHHVQLTVLRLKEAGVPVDMQALCCGLSGWFLRVVVFGSFHLGTRTPDSIGGMDYNILPIDIEQIAIDGSMHVRIPPNTYGFEGAVAAARKAVIEVIEANEGKTYSEDDQGGYEELRADEGLD